VSLNISETARVRIGKPARSWSLRLALGYCSAVAALTGSGCQLILDDIEQADDAIVDLDAAVAPARDAASSDGSGGGAPIDAASAAPPDVGPATEADVGSVPRDATPDVAEDVASPDSDPAACNGAGERTFYRDYDEDGQGDPDVHRNACEAPRGYVDDDRDCNDRNADVFRGQTAFFPDPYPVGDGTNSYDYDCNSDERGAPNFQPGQPCTTGGLLMCGGGGYEPNPNRAARSGVNPFCGSNLKLTCAALLPPLTGGCSAGVTNTTSEVFLCN
jgi:hypothetical protein